MPSPEDECRRYIPRSPDEKVCDYFMQDGACELPLEFMCVRWTNRFEAQVQGDIVKIRRKS